MNSYKLHFAISNADRVYVMARGAHRDFKVEVSKKEANRLIKRHQLTFVNGNRPGQFYGELTADTNRLTIKPVGGSNV